MIDLDVCEAVKVAQAEFERTGKMSGTRVCQHAIVCGDKACREAGHDHENYGYDGWCCEHECECLPACEGVPA